MTPPNMYLPVHKLLNALSGDYMGIDGIQRAFTKSPPPSIHQHGLSCLAPFLGRTFTSQKGIYKYFELLFSVMHFRNINFDPSSTWMVDTRNMTVSLRGTAVLTWNNTGMRWNEKLMYRLEISQDTSLNSRKKGQYLISDLQIWADTGAAYLARIGRLYTAEPTELTFEEEDDDWESYDEETSSVSSSPSAGSASSAFPFAAPFAAPFGTPFGAQTMALFVETHACERQLRLQRELELESSL